MKKRHRKRHPVRMFLVYFLLVLFCAAAAAGGYFGIKGYHMYRSALAQRPIEESVEEVRAGADFTRYDELPELYIKAVISVEDRRFEEHGGVDPIAICRALWTDLKTRSLAEGGSTITQQVAKNLLFTQEKKLERKVAECFAAAALESKYSKQEILELYVNIAYFGSGYYGVRAASEGYFGKQPAELTDYEAVMLAGLPNAPSAYSPDVSPELAKRRASQVLQSMVENRALTQPEADHIRDNAPAQ